MCENSSDAPLKLSVSLNNYGLQRMDTDDYSYSLD